MCTALNNKEEKEDMFSIFKKDISEPIVSLVQLMESHKDRFKFSYMGEYFPSERKKLVGKCYMFQDLYLDLNYAVMLLEGKLVPLPEGYNRECPPLLLVRFLLSPEWTIFLYNNEICDTSWVTNDEWVFLEKKVRRYLPLLEKFEERKIQLLKDRKRDRFKKMYTASK